MNQDTIISLVQESLITVIVVSAPPLLMGLIVGVIVSIFQTVTSIQEPTLAFVPKIVAVLVSLMIFGAFMLSNLQQFIINLFSKMQDFIIP